ncbi:MAG: AMP nucleosidase, partial [Bacteroidota bacterium]|nr:AMP nucleosidase [Bacteroidota bacterium]
GVKTDASDQIVTNSFVKEHLETGIDALLEIKNNGESVKHLKF